MNLWMLNLAFSPRRALRSPFDQPANRRADRRRIQYGHDGCDDSDWWAVERGWKGDVWQRLLHWWASAQTPEASQYTLVTAAHVFDRIAGENAQVAIRLKRDGQIVRMVVTVPIRKSTIRLYAKHPNADVAVMRVTLPDNNAHSMVSWPALATDEVFTRLGIHPGDEMFTVGYPLCTMANPQGYPMLRRGAVATPIHVPGIVLTGILSRRADIRREQRWSGLL